VAVQSVRLKEQEEVMGSGKLLAKGTVGVYCTREMPWHASLHQLYLHPQRHFTRKTCSVYGVAHGLRPTEGSAGESVPSAAILSGRDMRPMMSAARRAAGTEGSHTGHEP
jgi:hypothetical protein